MTRRIVAVRALVAVLLLTSLSVPAFGVAAGQADSSGPYSIDELRKGGEQINSDVESLRIIGENALFIDTAPTNPLEQDNPGSLTTGDVLESGERVTTNTLRVKWLSSTTDVSLKFHVVYWQAGTREVARNGTAVTEQYAANQTTTTHNVTFSEPFGTAEIPLREHYDKEVRMTVWVEGHEDTARWTATHKSLETSQTVATDTKGERLWWLVSDFVVWLLVFGFVAVGAVYTMLRRAGGGPQMGYATWAFLIGIGGFVAIAWNYQGIATLFVRGPKLLAGLTVLLLAIPIIEGHDDRLERYLFVRPVVTKAVSASGEDALDAMYLELASRKVTKIRGELSVIRSGPLRFLARVIGGKAPLIGAPDMAKTEVRATGDTRYDHVVWVNSDSENAIDDESEGFGWSWPDTEFWAIGAGGLITVIAGPLLGISWLPWLGALGLVAFVLDGLSIRSGYAKVDAAAAHERSAHITMMLGAGDFDDAKTLESAREETYKERARSSKDVEEVLEVRDESLLSEMMGADVSAKVTGDRDNGDMAADDEPAKSGDGHQERRDDDV